MKNKTCMICKLGINVDEQEYVEVKHYEKKDKILSKGFYHTNCFRDRLNGTKVQNAIQLKAMEILNKVGAQIN